MQKHLDSEFELSLMSFHDEGLVLRNHMTNTSFGRAVLTKSAVGLQTRMKDLLQSTAQKRRNTVVAARTKRINMTRSGAVARVRCCVRICSHTACRQHASKQIKF
jgi:hypothetical protein